MGAGRKLKRMRPKSRPVVDVDLHELKAIIERAKTGTLNDEEAGKLDSAVDTLATLTRELEAKGASIRRLRYLLFGPSSEKTDQVLGQSPGKQSEGGDQGDSQKDPQQSQTSEDDKGPDGAESSGDKKKRKGHGRNGADAYRGAEKIPVPHESLEHGDRCPGCGKGNVYDQDPSPLVRVRGVAPLSARVYELGRLRCGACGEVFTAKTPPEVGTEKYDESARAMVGLLSYGCGMPFNRLDKLEASLGIPLPAATQWELVEESARRLKPVHDEFIRKAAHGSLMHNDDTTKKILQLDVEPEAQEGQQKTSRQSKSKAERKGTFTTGIISCVDEHQIALFFTGRQHAGENLADLLAKRSEQMAPPIQMCDAHPCNEPGEFKTILANCMAHARRQFVEVSKAFPAEVRHVLEVLREVYHNDDIARKQGMSDEQRLRFHQRHSGALMGRLRRWMRQQFKQKRVEPNSELGGVIKYMLKHWKKLILFLKVPGAPLDNNIVERALKKAIRHRRNSLFYKTENGAWVGDVHMAFIHTAELCGANPFDYLMQLLRHADEAAENPGDWMPWNYLDTLAALPDDPKQCGNTTQPRARQPGLA